MTVLSAYAGRVSGVCYGALMNLPERPMRWAQSRLRDGRLGWLFVAPNLAVFGLFTFLPIAIDFWYALTGSTQLLPADRPYVGTANFADLLGRQGGIGATRAAGRQHPNIVGAGIGEKVINIQAPSHKCLSGMCRNL